MTWVLFKDDFDFFVLNVLQDSAIQTDILSFFLSVHSPMYFSLKPRGKETQGSGLWKFNDSIIAGSYFFIKLKNPIADNLPTKNQEKV